MSAAEERIFDKLDECVKKDDCEKAHATMARAMATAVQPLSEKMDVMNKRLFVDNGTVSIQTRIDRHTRILNVLVWVVAVCVSTSLIGVIGGAIKYFWFSP